VRFQLSQKKEEGNAYFKTKNKNKKILLQEESATHYLEVLTNLGRIITLNIYFHSII
jgi:hypothetical protein